MASGESQKSRPASKKCSLNKLRNVPDDVTALLLESYELVPNYSLYLNLTALEPINGE